VGAAFVVISCGLQQSESRPICIGCLFKASVVVRSRRGLGLSDDNPVTLSRCRRSRVECDHAFVQKRGSGQLLCCISRHCCTLARLTNQAEAEFEDGPSPASVSGRRVGSRHRAGCFARRRRIGRLEVGQPSIDRRISARDRSSSDRMTGLTGVPVRRGRLDITLQARMKIDRNRRPWKVLVRWAGRWPPSCGGHHS